MINPDVYSLAFSGAASGMAAVNRSSQNSNSVTYDNISQVAGAWATQFDTVWGSPAAITEAQALSIFGESQGFWQNDIAQANGVSLNPATWNPYIIALISVIVSNNNYLAAQGTPSPVWGGGPSTIGPWTHLTVDGATTIYTLTPNLALNEVLDIGVIVNMVKATGVATDGAVWQRRFFGIQNIGGVLQDPAGGTTDSNVFTPVIGAAFVGATAAIVISGTTVIVQVSRPTGVDCFVSATVDFVRGLASAVTSVSPSSALPTVVTPITITIGLSKGGTGAVGASVDGIPLTNVRTVNDNQVVGTLPAGTYTPGTGNVTVTSPSNPFPLVGGFSFATAGTITSVAGTVRSAWNGIGAVGGDTVTVTGTGFINGGPLAFNANGIPCTSVTFVSSTQCTCKVPAQAGVASPSSAFAFTGTNGDGNPLTSSATVTYQWDPSQLGTLKYWTRSDRGVTQGGGTVSSWAPIIDNTVGPAGPCVQASGASQPTYTASWTDGLPAISSLTGSTLTLVSAAFTAIPSPYTMSIVGQQNGAYPGSQVIVSGSATSNPSMWDFDPGAVGAAYLQTVAGSIQGSSGTTVKSPYSMAGVFQTSGTGTLNGAPFPGTSTGNLSGSTVTQITLMASGSATHPNDGFLGEVIIQGEARSVGDAAKMVTYNQAFWGLAG